MAIPYRTAKFKSTNIFAMAILGPTAKFNSHQYFRLYDMYTQGHFANLLIARSRKPCSVQSLDSCNQNPTYSISLLLLIFFSHRLRSLLKKETLKQLGKNLKFHTVVA